MREAPVSPALRTPALPGATLCGAALALLALFALPACMHARPAGELAAIERQHLWELQLPANLVMASFTPGGLVEANVAESLTKASAGERWLLLLETGAVLWKGPWAGSSVVADLPAPVLVLQGKSAFDVIALDGAGHERWRRSLPGHFVAAHVERGATLICLGVPQAWAGALPTKQAPELVALAMADGEPAWTTRLGARVVPARIDGGALAAGEGGLFVLLGGVLDTVVPATGQLSSSGAEGPAALPGLETWQPEILWRAHGPQLAAAAGRGVLIAGATGVTWKGVPDPEGLVHDLEWSSDRLLVGLHRSDGGSLALIDPASASPVWLTVESGDGDEHGAPSGVAIVDGAGYFAAGGNLIAVELLSGARRFSVPLERTAYAEYVMLLQRAGHVVLLGYHGLEARAARDGARLWGFDGFLTPPELVLKRAALAGAVMSAATSATAAMDRAQASYDAAQARDLTKVGRANVWSPQTRKRFLQAAQRGDASASKIEALSELTDYAAVIRMVSKGLALPRELRPERFASFLHPINDGVMELTAGSEVDVVLVDLDSGRRSDHPLRAGDGACLSNATFHEATMRVLEGFEAMGMFCERGKEVHGFRLDVPR